MANRLLAITRTSIPYIPDLKRALEDTNATIMMQQLEYWFDKMDYEPFFKFRDKPNSNHPKYKEGDSWAEELVFNAKEITSAFSVIGIAYKSVTEYLDVKDKKKENPFIKNGKEYFYLSYHDRVNYLTYYVRNDDFVDDFLNNLSKKDRKQAKQAVTPKMDFTVTPESDFTVTPESDFMVKSKMEVRNTVDYSTVDYSQDIDPNNNKADDLKKIRNYFEHELGRPLSGPESEKILMFYDTVGKDLTIEAFKRADLSGVRNFRYIDSIVMEFHKKGFRTIREAQEEDEKFRSRQANKDKQEKNHSPRTTSNKYDQDTYN